MSLIADPPQTLDFGGSQRMFGWTGQLSQGVAISYLWAGLKGGANLDLLAVAPAPIPVPHKPPHKPPIQIRGFACQWIETSGGASFTNHWKALHAVGTTRPSVALGSLDRSKASHGLNVSVRDSPIETLTVN